MKPSDDFETICERELISAEKGSLITIRFAKPEKDAGEDWYCKYQIDGLGDSSIQKAYGVDSMQSII